MSDEGSASCESAIGCDATQNAIHDKNENSMDHVKMEMPDMMDDSLDGGPPSVGSGEIIGHIVSGTGISAPVSAKKAKKDGKKLVTGYILYSSDIRRAVSAQNPESTFGDVSRIVGNEWRNLPQEVKTQWEEKAAKMNEEMAAKFAKEEAEANSQAGQIGPNHIVPAGELLWECCWDTCDFQFEEMSDCIEHCVGSGPDPSGHVHTYFANQPAESEWQCQWRNCGRIKKGAQPFPNLQRLARHVKEVHIQKSAGRVIPLHDRSKNFVISRKPRPQIQPTLNSTQPTQQPSFLNHGTLANANHLLAQARNTPSPHSQLNSIAVVNQPPKPTEPLFVSVPPKPQRLLHSEAYIKYIEGLSADNRSINNWEKQLKARPENVAVPDQSKLPAHWLANGVGNHGTMVNALWTLRDFMVRDALGISKLV